MLSVLRIIQAVSVVLFLVVSIPQIVAASGDTLHMRDGLHVPCSFKDTVNVTGDVRFANGSYLHQNVLIPAQLVGLYDYIYKDLVTRVDVEPHMRGCICKLKTCINFCCPWGTNYNHSLGDCVNTTDEIRWPEPKLNITMPGGEERPMNIFEQFAVQNFRPCEKMFVLQPEVNDFDEWQLFANGTILRVDDHKYMSKNEFCLVPSIVNDSDTVYAINPANCYYETEFGTMKIINAYAMLFSIPFMVLTIVVYLSIPELRNQHGKSLVCYLLGLIIGYSLLGCIALTKEFDMTNLACKTIGYTTYYFFMAAFFWLSVISFDLWHNFRGTHGVNRFQEKKRFLVYSLYAWGLAAIFLVFTWYAQEMMDIPEHYKPGIAGGTYCWLDMHNWAAMIYFFGPILLVIAANIVMFVMTAMKIHKVQREMARIMAREDSTRNLRTEKDKFGLFLRLFIVMGVTWSLEIMSYFVGSEHPWAKIFYITDICNAMQGFLIFMLFVMKKKVKNLITNRLLKCKTTSQASHSNSTNSTNSGLSQNPIQDKFAMQTAKVHGENGVKNGLRY